MQPAFPNPPRPLILGGLVAGLSGAFLTTAWQIGHFGVAPCVSRISEIADGHGPMWDSRKTSGGVSTEDYGSRVAPTFEFKREERNATTYLLYIHEVWGMRPGWFGATKEVGRPRKGSDGRDVHWSVITSGPLTGHLWARFEGESDKVLIYSYGWACRKVEDDPSFTYIRAPQDVCDVAVKYR